MNARKYIKAAFFNFFVRIWLLYDKANWADISKYKGKVNAFLLLHDQCIIISMAYLFTGASTCLTLWECELICTNIKWVKYDRSYFNLRTTYAIMSLIIRKKKKNERKFSPLFPLCVYNKPKNNVLKLII